MQKASALAHSPPVQKTVAAPLGRSPATSARNRAGLRPPCKWTCIAIHRLGCCAHSQNGGRTPWHILRHLATARRGHSDGTNTTRDAARSTSEASAFSEAFEGPKQASSPIRYVCTNGSSAARCTGGSAFRLFVVLSLPSGLRVSHQRSGGPTASTIGASIDVSVRTPRCC